MKKHYLLIVLLAMASSVCGQNFNPILGNRASFFMCNSENRIMGIRVDSITTHDTDIIYHFHRTWDYQKANGYGGGEDECVTPDGPSWIGHQAIQKEDGRFLFTNYEKDTLTLKPRADIDSTWVFYTFANGNELWATVDSIYTDEVLGVTGLLKRISFKRMDSEGGTIESDCNDLKVIISESLGFVTVFPFRNLYVPEDGYYIWGNYDIPFDNYSLIGLTNPGVGKNFITNISIFDFEVGDEFHYKRGSTWDIGSSDWGFDETKRISTVLEKTYSEEDHSIHYKWNNKKRYAKTQYKDGIPTEEVEYSEYTTTTKLNISDTIYYFPEVAYIEEGDALHYTQQRYAHQRMSIARIVNPEIMEDEFPCWRIIWPVKHSTYEDYGYGEGLGELGSYFDGLASSSSMSLAYYKKGNETWGTPLEISSAPAVVKDFFAIYPNPVAKGNYATIDPGNDHEAYELTLLNSEGMALQRLKNVRGKYSLHIPMHTPAGLYIIILRSTTGKSLYGKLLIQ